MDAYVLIGSANTRKSSTVRALTESSAATLKSSYRWDVAFGTSTLQTVVVTGALQDSQIDAITFINAVHSAGAIKAIFPLRYHAARGKPDAQAYLNAFAAVGWTIHIAEMQAGMKLGSYATVQNRHNASSIASNLTAAALRHAWGVS